MSTLFDGRVKGTNELAHVKVREMIGGDPPTVAVGALSWYWASVEWRFDFNRNQNPLPAVLVSQAMANMAATVTQAIQAAQSQIDQGPVRPILSWSVGAGGNLTRNQAWQKSSLVLAATTRALGLPFDTSYKPTLEAAQRLAALVNAAIDPWLSKADLSGETDRIAVQLHKSRVELKRLQHLQLLLRGVAVANWRPSVSACTPLSPLCRDAWQERLSRQTDPIPIDTAPEGDDALCLSIDPFDPRVWPEITKHFGLRMKQVAPDGVLSQKGAWAATDQVALFGFGDYVADGWDKLQDCLTLIIKDARKRGETLALGAVREAYEQIAGPMQTAAAQGLRRLPLRLASAPANGVGRLGTEPALGDKAVRGGSQQAGKGRRTPSNT
jgi:hypothetical protein